MVYAEIEPFGEWRADLRAGIIASTVANGNRDPKKQKKPFRPEDFMYEFGKRNEEPTPEDRTAALLRQAEMINAALGGKDLRKHGNTGKPDSLNRG